LLLPNGALRGTRGTRARAISRIDTASRLSTLTVFICRFDKNTVQLNTVFATCLLAAMVARPIFFGGYAAGVLKSISAVWLFRIAVAIRQGEYIAPPMARCGRGGASNA
jgi:hypothetical protein